MHGATREETRALVRWLRLTLRLTQEQAGTLLGTKPACVSRWESGKTRLSRGKLCQLRLLQRAVAARGEEFMRREAESLDLGTAEGVIRLVHLGDAGIEAEPLTNVASVNIART